MYFNNTILMAELEGKLYQFWLLSQDFWHDFHKGLVYLCIKKISPPLLCFGNYNPKIVSKWTNNFLDWSSTTPPNPTPKG